MTEAILDTSVLLAFAFGENHEVDPDEILADAAICAVNHAEAISVLRQKDVPEDAIRATLHDFNLKVLPFDEAASNIAGALISKGRPLGIGLGDCACIATGITRNATIYTADRDWLKLDVEANIKLIR